VTPPASPTAPTLRFDQGTLHLSGPIDPAWLQLIPDLVWTWDDRVAAWRADACRYVDLRRALRAAGVAGAVRDEVSAAGDVRWTRDEIHPLRQAQAEALEAWRRARGRGLVVMPTGTGKTEVALEAMRRVGRSTLVVAPIRDLMYQWHRRILHALGVDAGVLGDGSRDVREVTVTTYDSAAIHMRDIGARFDLIIFDEVHHLPGSFRREAALMSAATYRLGLTATPERQDGRHEDLNHLIGPVVYSQSIAEVKGTVLADYDVIRVPVRLEQDEQRRYDEASRAIQGYISERRREVKGYEWKDVLKDAALNPEARRAKRAMWVKHGVESRAREKFRVLEDLFRLHAADRVLVFTGSNATAVEISRRFLLPTLLSHTKKDERHEALERFERGEARALVTNRVLDEGVDVPEARVAVVLGGMGSPRQAKQRLGRILRRDGERRAILYEVVCQETREVERSRKRRRSDAYAGTRHRRL
jgi:superfamily II DNA or RNA helicase